MSRKLRHHVRPYLLFSLLLLAVSWRAGIHPAAAQTASGSGGLEEAQSVAGRLVIDRLGRVDPGGLARLRLCPPRHVLLVDGRHDHTDRVLRALGIPFSRCPADALSHRSLNRVGLLIVDCPGEVHREGARRIRDFVERGGTLLSTDWAVLHVLEGAFPGLVRYTRRPARDDVVRISRVTPDPLLQRVFPPGRPACWWIENRSFPVAIIDRRRVRVLLESEEMGRKYGSPILAFTFRHGRGRVVHVVSHTYLQRNELRRPWESRPAVDEVASLGLSTTGEAYRRLKADGTLDRIAAGDLNAALSAQQFLLNILLASVEVTPVAPPPPPPLPPAPLAGVHAARETALRDRPSGTPVLHVARGLRLWIEGERDGWLRVRTPAGQEGWVARDDVQRRR